MRQRHRFFPYFMYKAFVKFTIKKWVIFGVFEAKMGEN